MDFDSVIIFIFIVAFFILPSILKQMKAGAKKAKPGEAQSSGTLKPQGQPSILQNLGEKITKFVRELEEQALQQQNAGKEKSQSSEWDMLMEDDAQPAPLHVRQDTDADFNLAESPGVPEPFQSDKPVQFAQSGPAGENDSQGQYNQSENEIGFSGNKNISKVKKPALQSRKEGRFKSNHLQNAMVWSEILSKPVALKKDS